MSDLLIKRSAIFSDDGVYRYRLDRDLNRPGRVASITMVNGSTAGGEVDDHTIRKWYGFADRFDIGRFIVGNKFGLAARDVRRLGQVADPIGPENDRHLAEIAGEADLHIVAWGPLGKLPPSLRGRWIKVVAILHAANARLMCLGIANDGQPLHPLTLGYERELVEWSPPA